MRIADVTTEPQNQTADDIQVTNPCNESPQRKSRSNQRAWDRKSITTSVAAILVLLAIYLLRLDKVVGQFRDDGWYIVLAKSLATGNGYNLINLPQHSGLYFYPPLFPLLLSLLYRLSPQFPGNVFLLKLLSIFSMLFLPVLVFRLFSMRHEIPRALVYLISFSSAAAPSFVMLATSSVMTECVFTALMFATLLAVEQCSGSQPATTGLGKPFIVAVLASACYLTRTIGIAVLAAVAVYFLVRKMYKPLVLFVAGVTVCITPWTFYQHSLLPENSGRARVAAGYSSQFWDRYAGVPGPKATVRDLPGRVWQVFTVMVGDDIGGLVAPSLYRSGNESGQELVGMTALIPGVSPNFMHMTKATMGLAVSGQLISFGLTIPMVVGFLASAKTRIRSMELVFCFTLIILVVWPSSPIRYMVPLLPFLLYYLVLGTARIYRVVLGSRHRSQDVWSASRVVMLCILVLFLYDNATYIVAKHKDSNSLEHPDWLRHFYAAQDAMHWVHDHTLNHEVVGGDNLPMTYLYAQRETAMCDVDKCSDEGIRYYVDTGDVDFPDSAELVFRTGYQQVQVIDVSNRNK